MIMILGAPQFSLLFLLFPVSLGYGVLLGLVLAPALEVEGAVSVVPLRVEL